MVDFLVAAFGGFLEESGEVWFQVVDIEEVAGEAGDVGGWEVGVKGSEFLNFGVDFGLGGARDRDKGAVGESHVGDGVTDA